jgi:hypothetical protein
VFLNVDPIFLDEPDINWYLVTKGNAKIISLVQLLQVPTAVAQGNLEYTCFPNAFSAVSLYLVIDVHLLLIKILSLDSQNTSLLF